MKAKLTPKQRMFVAEYLTDLNATKAAIAAGYSERTAKAQASRLLTNVNVAEEIAARADKRAEKLGISADRVLNELAKLAFMDPRKLYNADGTLKGILELDDDTAACIAGIEVEELWERFGGGQAKKKDGALKKIKFADKGMNLERLGRHLKLFTDKLEVSGNDALYERIQRARQQNASKPN